MTSAANNSRVLLITGAASGIGAATARRFISEGRSVAINYLEDGQRDAAMSMAAAATKPGQKALAIKADVAKDEHCRRLV